MEKNLEKKTSKRSNSFTDNHTPRLLTLKGAAEYSGFSVWSLRSMLWSGYIPAVRFPGGRKIFIDRDDLEEFIQKNKARYT